VTKQDIFENQVRAIYIGIGSNLGNKKQNIEKAKFELIQNNVEIIQSSSFYESLSWPNPKYPRYLNIVLRIKTEMTPLELLNLCKKIEITLGRKKSLKNSPRKCDIDILDFEKKTSKYDVILPHPRMHNRNFVLLPLFEINRDWIHPTFKLHIKRLILLLSNRDISSIKQI